MFCWKAQPPPDFIFFTECITILGQDFLYGGDCQMGRIFIKQATNTYVVKCIGLGLDYRVDI